MSQKCFRPRRSLFLLQLAAVPAGPASPCRLTRRQRRCSRTLTTASSADSRSDTMHLTTGYGDGEKCVGKVQASDTGAVCTSYERRAIVTGLSCTFFLRRSSCFGIISGTSFSLVDTLCSAFLCGLRSSALPASPMIQTWRKANGIPLFVATGIDVCVGHEQPGYNKQRGR